LKQGEPGRFAPTPRTLESVARQYLEAEVAPLVGNDKHRTQWIGSPIEQFKTGQNTCAYCGHQIKATPEFVAVIRRKKSR